MVIHWPIVRGPPVKNSTGKGVISAAPTDEQQATVVELVVVMALVIVAVQGIEVGGQIAAEARLESVLPVAVKRLARPTGRAALEIVALELSEIALGLATLEVVLGTWAPSETVPETAAEVPAQVAAGVLAAWAVRAVEAELAAEVDIAELAAEAGEVVAVAAVVGGSEVIANINYCEFPYRSASFNVYNH